MIIVIETPKGSAQKYNYDPVTHFFKLKKVLPAGIVFPYDFGFIPDTKGDDGDPIDVILLNEFPSFPGCMVDARLIGAMRACQVEEKKKVRNDRFICVNTLSSIFSRFHTIKDVPLGLLDELQDFFIHYHLLEGKTFTVTGKISAAKAGQLIKTNQTKNE